VNSRSGFGGYSEEIENGLEGVMQNPNEGFLWDKPVSRRGFLKGAMAGVCLSMFNSVGPPRAGAAGATSSLFWIRQIPGQPFTDPDHGNYHSGIEKLLSLMGTDGLKFYRSSMETMLSGPQGLIASDDVVLIKVNGQWKYRGCTNSDLIRGLIQRILDHPDGFTGEVVIFENGQGRGSLNCDTTSGYPDAGVHANANEESHSFLYLVNAVFQDPRVSATLLDPIRDTFIESSDHITDGYRRFENVSYPCFTTARGHRVELGKGVWTGSEHKQNLKLINVPVLKYHDTGGSEITASLKHVYGVLSMSDGNSSFRHYGGLGETCGKMMVSVRTPVLNIIDAIWVSYASLAGYPADTTARANQILASQDPVALDYWAAKYILYPISNNPGHFPTPGGIVDGWLTGARDMINGRGGLLDPGSGILVDQVTKNEASMKILISQSVKLAAPVGGEVIFSGSNYSIRWDSIPQAVAFNLMLSFDRGSSWTPIPGAQGIAGTSHNWSVPSPGRNKKNCLIKVTGFDSGGKKVGSDRSGAPFAIQVVRLTAPNGGEVLYPGQVVPILWETHGTKRTVAEVRVYFTKDGERTWDPIGVVPDNPESYDNWTVPAVSRTRRKCKVKIVLGDERGLRLGADASDSFFVIQP
jgi:hypothetical protein